MDVTICEVCNGTISLDKSIPINSLNKSLIEVIRKEHPNILEEGSICLECLNHYRTCHLADVLKVEKRQSYRYGKEYCKECPEERNTF